MILVDYSQVCLASIFAFSSDLKKGGSEADAKNLIRHVTLSSIKSYKKKYQKEFGKLVIACDGQGYWRKQIFPQYKAGRKKAREDSPLNWDLIFECLNEIREDLTNHFPYKVVRVDGAEADDVIAVVTETTQEFGQYEPVMIISSDGDFKQLHKYDNVKQYSPMQKKLVKCPNPAQYLLEHVAKAGDDGIPNVLSPDDTFVSGTRQKTMNAQRLEEFVKKGFMACRTDEERKNYTRNKVLIDFSQIPEYIKKSILDEYEKTPQGDKNSVMNYLIKHKCRLLLNEVEDF
jgi:hypothetical protein